MTRSAGTLVVVDMQEIFRSEDSQWCVPRYDEAAQNVARLAAAFENVVWTRFVRDPDERGSWQAYYERWDGCRAEPGSAVWDITLPTAAEHATLTLPTFSKWGDELAELTSGSAEITVCGVATDCCVLSTVLGAADAGKSITVIGDACAGATDEAHEQALSLLGLLAPMVTIRTTDEVLTTA